MKIVRVETIGFKNTRRLLSRSYDLTRQEFASRGKILPPASVLDFKRNSDYRMFLTPRKIILHTEQDGVLIFRFDEGYITDLVSSPRIFRSLVDNDDARLVEASLVHDALFQGHFLSFELSNNLFYQMMRLERFGLVRSLLALRAVSGRIGRRCYDNDTEIKEYQKRHISFEWADRFQAKHCVV